MVAPAFLRMVRILIIGGAGYVGSHCARAFADSRHQGVVFDSFPFGHREFVRWGELIEGDIPNAAALESVFNAQRINVACISVFSLAFRGRRSRAREHTA